MATTMSLLRWLVFWSSARLQRWPLYAVPGRFHYTIVSAAGQRARAAPQGGQGVGGRRIRLLPKLVVVFLSQRDHSELRKQQIGGKQVPARRQRAPSQRRPRPPAARSPWRTGSAPAAGSRYRGSAIAASQTPAVPPPPRGCIRPTHALRRAYLEGTSNGWAHSARPDDALQAKALLLVRQFSGQVARMADSYQDEERLVKAG